MKQQITYRDIRDKAAPPQDWSQFVLDPIALPRWIQEGCRKEQFLGQHSTLTNKIVFWGQCSVFASFLANVLYCPKIVS